MSRTEAAPAVHAPVIPLQKLGRKTKVVRDVIREVAGYAPYEKRVMELLKEGVKVGNAGMQESAVKVLRKLANAGPLSQAGPLRRQRLEDMNVDACVSEAMKQPRASDSFKKDGQMLRNRLRK